MAQKRIIIPLILKLILIFICIADTTQILAQTPEEEKYTKKSITYLKIVFTPEVDRVSRVTDFLTGFNVKEYLEKKIREEIEMRRFDYNPVEVPGNTDLEALAKLVKEYVDMVKVDRAKAEAQMDWRFKDLVITAEDIRKIANSAYIYWPEVKKFNVIVSPTRRKDEVRLAITVKLGVKVNYYRVDFETGKPIKIAEIYEEHAESGVVGEIELLPLPFPLSLLSPSVEILETPWDTFARCSEKAIYWISKKINKATRKIPDFTLHARIASKSIAEVFSPLQEKDGVYLDSDFAVVEEVEGEEGKISQRRVGWVRARKIADGKTQELSSFQILSGSPQIGQKIVEYPLVGIGLLLEGIHSPASSILVNDPEFEKIEGKGGTGISLLGRINFATAFGVKISELYLLGGPHILFVNGGLDAGGNIGLKKKFYVIRYLAASPEFLFNISFLYVGLTKKDTKEIYSGRGVSLGIVPKVHLEWFLHPRFSVFLGGGYRLSSEITEATVSKDENTSVTIPVSYKPSGPIFFGGLEFVFW